MTKNKTSEKTEEFVQKGVLRTEITEWDGKLGEIWHTEFIGRDGVEYQVVMRGEKVYVNGARMLSWKDRPCEYIGRCMANNENCSYEANDLPATEEKGCQFYVDHKYFEKQHQKRLKAEAKDKAKEKR